MEKGQKKKLDADLWIIALITMGVYTFYFIFGSKVMEFCKNSSIPVFPRLFAAAAMEFGISGLGITVDCLIRKERFTEFGLKKENALKAILLTVICFFPFIALRFLSGEFEGYEPLSIMVTPDLHKAGIITSIIGTLVIAIVWGFFEGFNYVVIGDKISLRYPSKKEFWDWGAFICALMGILFHPISTSFSGIADIISTFIALYGMIIIKKKTGNAWGAVFAFLFIWNAF